MARMLQSLEDVTWAMHIVGPCCSEGKVKRSNKCSQYLHLIGRYYGEVSGKAVPKDKDEKQGGRVLKCCEDTRDGHHNATTGLHYCLR